MASAENTVVINRPVAEVFAFVAEPTNEPKWNTEVTEVESFSDSPLRLGSTMVWIVNFMGSKAYTNTVTAFELDKRIEIKASSDAPLPVTLTHSFRPVEGGTAYTRHFEVEPTGIMKLFIPIMQLAGIPTRRQQLVTGNLKRLLEE